MARDPPSLLASSELRDLPWTPSDIRPARITITHPQLRDVILPLERGRLLHPRGQTIQEMKWKPEADKDDEDLDGDEGMGRGGLGAGPSKGSSTSTTRTFANLSFLPNCLTARGSVMACGGQHGELFMTDISSPSSSSRTTRNHPSASVRPFTLSTTLPTRSINNSILILPGWPDEWKATAKRRRAGFVGARATDQSDEDNGLERNAERGRSKLQDDEDLEDVLMELDDEDEARNDDALHDDDDDMSEDGDLEEGGYYAASSPTSSVATYPNTVPFIHPPRIPHLSPTAPTHLLPSASSSTSWRRSSFSGPDQPSRPRTDRSWFGGSSLRRPAMQPPSIHYVTSLPTRAPSVQSGGYPRPDSRMSGISGTSSQPSGNGRSTNVRREYEPRVMISNNDQSVKMFSLRSLRSGLFSSYAPTASSHDMRVPATSAMRRTVALDDRDTSPRSFEFTGPRGFSSASLVPPSAAWQAGAEAMQPMQESAQSDNAPRRRRRLVYPRPENEQEATLRREREIFEGFIGMQVNIAARRRGDGVDAIAETTRSTGQRNPSPLSVKVDKEERRLAKVGGTKFKTAINHSSLSPDLKTMVSVGDSTDVYLFEVVDAGREFRRIGVYTAATDSGFSTAWSKDGRRFAVASQDGQVTVWDHRSSKPLAKFYTNSSYASPLTTPPSFTADLATSRRRNSDLYTGASPSLAMAEPVLIDPITGSARSGGSNSGREAARVVKFSPEGSSRDLMVFSEENTNIHVIDAKTFNSHLILQVPHFVPGPTVDPRLIHRERTGVENGSTGIAGIGFNPTGDWLYSGTEGTIVEWDLRRLGGGEGATWQMA